MKTTSYSLSAVDLPEDVIIKLKGRLFREKKKLKDVLEELLTNYAKK